MDYLTGFKENVIMGRRASSPGGRFRERSVRVGKGIGELSRQELVPSEAVLVDLDRVRRWVDDLCPHFARPEIPFDDLEVGKRAECSPVGILPIRLTGIVRQGRDLGRKEGVRHGRETGRWPALGGWFRWCGGNWQPRIRSGSRDKCACPQFSRFGAASASHVLGQVGSSGLYHPGLDSAA